MKKNILIVDDNISICNILSDFFKSIEDINICCVCHNGVDAIKAISKFKPDIILLDLIMPKLDGLGVLQFLNKKEANAFNPKVIILSAVGQDDILKEAFFYGAQYYMIKPFSLKTLGERINIILKNNTNIVNAQGFNESKILKTVIDVGIPTNILGYRYTTESLKIILEKPNSWLVSDLYKSIAEKNSTSEQCVENAIRNAISRAHKKDNFLYQKLFPRNISERRPSNSLFLTVLAENIRIENN